MANRIAPANPAGRARQTLAVRAFLGKEIAGAPPPCADQDLSQLCQQSPPILWVLRIAKRGAAVS